MDLKEWKEAVQIVFDEAMDNVADDPATSFEVMEEAFIYTAELEIKEFLKAHGRNYVGLLERTVAPQIEHFENECAEWSNGPALFDIMAKHGQISQQIGLGYFPIDTTWNFSFVTKRSLFGSVSLHPIFGRVQDRMELGVRPEDLAQGKPAVATGQIHVVKRSIIRYHIDELASKQFGTILHRHFVGGSERRRSSATEIKSVLRLLAYKVHNHVVNKIVLRAFEELSGERFIEFERSMDPLDPPENACASIEFIKTVNDHLWKHKEYRPVRLREMSDTMTSTSRSDDDPWEDEVQDFQEDDDDDNEDDQEKN